MREASWRSASGGIASSLVATRNQVGTDFYRARPSRPRTSSWRGLSGEHDPRARRLDICGEVADEVCFRQPGKALLVDDQVRKRGRGGPAAEKRAERLAL